MGEYALLIARTGGPEWWFWLVSGVLLVWGLAYLWLTFFSFVLADSEDWNSMVEKGRILPEYVEYIAQIPNWVIGITAVAALSRLGGAVGLLFCQRWSIWAYALSLGCVAVIMFRGFVLADVASVIRTSQLWVEALFMAMSIFAVWFSVRVFRLGLLS